MGSYRPMLGYRGCGRHCAVPTGNEATRFMGIRAVGKPQIWKQNSLTCACMHLHPHAGSRALSHMVSPGLWAHSHPRAPVTQVTCRGIHLQSRHTHTPKHTPDCQPEAPGQPAYTACSPAPSWRALSTWAPLTPWGRGHSLAGQGVGSLLSTLSLQPWDFPGLQGHTLDFTAASPGLEHPFACSNSHSCSLAGPQSCH